MRWPCNDLPAVGSVVSIRLRKSNNLTLVDGTILVICCVFGLPPSATNRIGSGASYVSEACSSPLTLPVCSAELVTMGVRSKKKNGTAALEHDHSVD